MVLSSNNFFKVRPFNDLSEFEKYIFSQAFAKIETPPEPYFKKPEPQPITELRGDYPSFGYALGFQFEDGSLYLELKNGRFETNKASQVTIYDSQEKARLVQSNLQSYGNIRIFRVIPEIQSTGNNPPLEIPKDLITDAWDG